MSAEPTSLAPPSATAQSTPPAGSVSLLEPSLQCSQQALTVMSWNILARPYTHHNWQHGVYWSDWQDKDGRPRETHKQAQARYGLAIDGILEVGPDVVLLQECEEAFFDPSYNHGADQLLRTYDHFHCCLRARHAMPEGGTAVLVKKHGQVETAREAKAWPVGGTRETGGCSKIATVLPAKFSGRDVLIVSAHFSGSGEHLQYALADLLASQMQQRDYDASPATSTAVILGGDFNCDVKRADKLAARVFGGDHLSTRAQLKPGTKTGMNGDFTTQVCIDHVYVTNEMVVLEADVRGSPGSPWSWYDGTWLPTQVAAASDHVPLVVSVAVRDDLHARTAGLVSAVNFQ
mmetsp:Transcript_25004/g.58052  ORF Transcript_25004/g.58052 Transcript_25004/m.58052 type:complete len:347 (-) Transcript_25004:246-1286(-)